MLTKRTKSQTCCCICHDLGQMFTASSNMLRPQGPQQPQQRLVEVSAFFGRSRRGASIVHWSGRQDLFCSSGAQGWHCPTPCQLNRHAVLHTIHDTLHTIRIEQQCSACGVKTTASCSARASAFHDRSRQIRILERRPAKRMWEASTLCLDVEICGGRRRGGVSQEDGLAVQQA